MHFMHTVTAVACCFVINIDLLKSDNGQDEVQKSVEDIEDTGPTDEEIIRDGHSFVALLDIMYQDETKRTCTGAIIHDNVVLTAAHCFVHELDENVQPELTSSFVIIGTKKMFKAGYEQYLPIERILTHPKYDGWSADICLVYTFAGMTLDKPGKVIKLAGEKTVNQADYNMTVLAWRHPKNDDTIEEVRLVKTSTPCDGSSSLEDKDVARMGSDNENPEDTATEFVVESNKNKKRRDRDRPAGTQMPNWYARGYTLVTASTKKEKDSVPGGLFYKYPVLQQKMQPQQDHPLEWKNGGNKKMSRYLTSNEETEQQDDANIAVILMSPDNDSVSNKAELYNVTLSPLTAGTGNNKEASPRFPLRMLRKGTQTARRRRPFNGWRRIMFKLSIQLETDRYTLISSSTCKKILENALAPRFLFNNGEVACYSSEEHILTDEDAGAPAVRRSRLVAVTIGGAESDGDHVGVGLKISCYCQWIADNIPGGSSINCCKNCCDVKHTERYVHTTSKRRRKNKYLL